LEYRTKPGHLQPRRQTGSPASGVTKARKFRPDVVVSVRFVSFEFREASMSLSMSTVATQSFLQTLAALSKILDKAAAHCAAKKIDQAVSCRRGSRPTCLPS